MGETNEEGASAATQKLDLWAPYRDLYHKIDRVLYQSMSDDTPEAFNNLLMKHKQNFICLLQNPPKSAKSRDELKEEWKMESLLRKSAIKFYRAIYTKKLLSFLICMTLTNS